MYLCHLQREYSGRNCLCKKFQAPRGLSLFLYEILKLSSLLLFSGFFFFFFFCLQGFLSGPLLFCLPILSNCQKSHSASPELWPPRQQEIQSLSFWCKYCGEIIGSLTSSLFKHLRQLTDQYAVSFESSATDQSQAYLLFFLMKCHEMCCSTHQLTLESHVQAGHNEQVRQIEGEIQALLDVTGFCC